jgi:hypothetical protein
MASEASVRRHVAAVGVIVALVGAIARIAATPAWTADDAFIVARYAEHLAHHGQLAFNLGEPPVEGVTGLALVLIEAASALVGVRPEATGVALGCAALVGAAPLLWAIGRELRLGRLTTVLFALAYFGAPEHAVHARSGLETEIYLTVTLVCVWGLARALRRVQPRYGVLVLSAVLLAAIRPEGLATGTVAMALVVLRHRRIERRAIVLFVAPVLAMQVARVAYFGALLPNTYYAKRADHFTPMFLRDLSEVASGYFGGAVLVTGGILVLHRVLARPAPPPTDDRHLEVAGAALALLAISGFVYGRADLVMNYAHRFVIHLLPWLAVGGAILVDCGVRTAATFHARGERVALAVLGGLAVLGAHDATADRLATERRFAPAYLSLEYQHREIADVLVRRLPPTATIACYPDAGLVPYQTGLRTLDFGKLNDAYLAREAKTPALVADYFFRNAPDALVVSRLADEVHMFDAGADAILADPRFAAAYEHATVFAENGEGYGLLLYLRR